MEPGIAGLEAPVPSTRGRARRPSLRTANTWIFQTSRLAEMPPIARHTVRYRQVAAGLGP